MPGAFNQTYTAVAWAGADLKMGDLLALSFQSAMRSPLASGGFKINGARLDAVSGMLLKPGNGLLQLHGKLIEGMANRYSNDQRVG